jgi:archaemetzincin
MEIWLQPLGQVDINNLEVLQSGIQHVFGCPVNLKPSQSLPLNAFNQERKQYLSDILLEQLKADRHVDKRILGITGVNLYTEGLNFVFGQADSLKGVAVISLFLLHQSYYGLPEDEGLLNERVLKEAVHEIGHTFGLDHCSDGYCVMHFSNSLMDTDIKKSVFCSRCQPRLLF